jgi:glyoxylase-like metal-dependent hydrolase (beta-lactamase superfamily II)
MVGHVTSSPAPQLDRLPAWVTLLRAANPSLMTLDGTNSWLLRAPGAETYVVIDPGPLEEAHLAALAERGPVAVILVTHHHPDHVEGLPRFRELSGVKETPMHDGTVIVEDAGVRIVAHATPGHTADSMSFLATCGDESVVLTGDTILGLGTTVVAHPDGDLGAYLGSLRLLAEFGPLPVLPGHGPALADCEAAARFYLDHRLARLEQVAEALRNGAQTAADVVRLVYADVDPALWPAAEQSVAAALDYLRGVT